MSKKTVVIPVGDVAGVGPEIAVKALAHPEVYEWCSRCLWARNLYWNVR